VRITVEEAAALQSFPPGYPWHGRVGDKHRQVGDAVPPLLAAHVIAACLGVQVESLEVAA
jgi:DNA (cytosine-5)-methyltransferase 1